MKLNQIKIKKLIINLKKNSGRNNTGKITIKNRGGGLKNLYRIIDYKRFLTLPAIVLKQENLKQSTATIALILYKNGLLSYITSAHSIINGDIINVIQEKNLASVVLLKNVYVGNILYNLELSPGLGSQFCRAAGAFFQILNIYKYAQKSLLLIRLKSKKKYLINPSCSAIIGVASYLYYPFYYPYKKAGQSRNLGKRPHVRGVAMNPVDHPHGGNTSGGRCSVSYSGVLAKGYKTKKRKNFFSLFKKKNAF